MQVPDLGFSFSAQNARPRLKWPSGKRVALIFHLPLEHWDPISATKDAFNSKTVTAERSYPEVPDIVTYLRRDFGHRVGLWRLMSLFDNYGIKPSCPLNVEFAKLFPTVMKEVRTRGWELTAHAYTQNDRMPMFRDEESEKEFIQRNLIDFQKAVGRKSEGWVSPGVTPTLHTGKIVAELGIKFYCDYQNDDQPYLIRSGSSSTVCVPYSNELGDYTLYSQFHYTPDEVLSIMKEHFDYLYSEGRTQAKMMHISMHAHVSGQASRIRALERAIRYFAKHEKVWFATRTEVANWYLGLLNTRA